MAGGSETEDTKLIDIGMQQMGQSSFGGGSLNNNASSRSSATRCLHPFMFQPIIPLALSVAVLDEPTRHTRLETDAAPLLLAAIGTAHLPLFPCI